MAVDLDAARAARDEARGEPPSVTFGGREYKLVAELSLEALDAWNIQEEPNAVRGRAFMAAVLADPSELDDFMANRPNWRDLNGVLDALGATAGESSAS